MVYIKLAVPEGGSPFFRIPPMIIIPVRAVTGTAALFKPLMLITAVINYQVHDQLDPAFMYAFQ